MVGWLSTSVNDHMKKLFVLNTTSCPCFLWCCLRDGPFRAIAEGCKVLDEVVLSPEDQIAGETGRCSVFGITCVCLIGCSSPEEQEITKSIVSCSLSCLLQGVSPLMCLRCTLCHETFIRSFFWSPNSQVGQHRGDVPTLVASGPPGWWPRCVFGGPKRWKRNKCCPLGDGGPCCGARAGVSQGQLHFGPFSLIWCPYQQHWLWEKSLLPQARGRHSELPGSPRCFTT